MNPNERQVGGTYYKNGKCEHWESDPELTAALNLLRKMITEVSK